MARRGRAHRWGATVHVFNRTWGQLHRLKPVKKMTDGIESLLIRLQRRHRMGIVAYALLSNTSEKQSEGRVVPNRYRARGIEL